VRELVKDEARDLGIAQRMNVESSGSSNIPSVEYAGTP
jgi:hypothetical protein